MPALRANPWILIVLRGVTACAGASVPAATATVTAPAAQPTAAPTVTVVPPTPVALPDGLIRLPVPLFAEQTAAALRAAAHVPRDNIQLSVQLKNLKALELTPQPMRTNWQVGDSTEFLVNTDLGADYQPRLAYLRYSAPHSLWWLALNAQAT